MKREILKKLREGVKLTSEEINIISKEFTRDKKYGLVWEDHPEGVDLELKDGVFKIEELKDKKISMDPNGRENLLLEGDNLHSLMALKEAGVEVDIIYIDPPYNTLNEKGFRYNDKMIDKNDSYRHSKWLSFMNKRLELARDLLTNDGIIFVSIDDNEQANLKLLMDKIFGEENFISNMVWEKGGGKSDSKYLANKKEYVLIYKKNTLSGLSQQPSPVENYKHKDYRGYYSINGFARRGLKYSKSLDYPIEAPDGSNIYPGDDYELWIKRQSGEVDERDWCWTLSKDEFQRRLDNDEIVFIKRGQEYKVYYKSYIEGKTYPYSDIYREATNASSSKEIIDIFNSKIFEYTKPTKLISHLVNLHPNKNTTILDFFAGSGTTGHAVMELNKEDGGNRRFILCTNNENNICEEITYERNKRVITGEYAEKNIEPLPNNLSYYKVDIKNIDNLNVYEKKVFDNYRSIVQVLWKNDYKIVSEEKEFIEVKNLDENSIIIKLDTIDEEFRDGVDLNKFNKIYAKKHLSREKTFKGIDESKLIFY